MPISSTNYEVYISLPGGQTTEIAKIVHSDGKNGLARLKEVVREDDGIIKRIADNSKTLFKSQQANDTTKSVNLDLIIKVSKNGLFGQKQTIETTSNISLNDQGEITESIDFKCAAPVTTGKLLTGKAEAKLERNRQDACNSIQYYLNKKLLTLVTPPSPRLGDDYPLHFESLQPTPELEQTDSFTLADIPSKKTASTGKTEKDKYGLTDTLGKEAANAFESLSELFLKKGTSSTQSLQNVADRILNSKNRTSLFRVKREIDSLTEEILNRELDYDCYDKAEELCSTVKTAITKLSDSLLAKQVKKAPQTVVKNPPEEVSDTAKSIQQPQTPYTDIVQGSHPELEQQHHILPTNINFKDVDDALRPKESDSNEVKKLKEEVKSTIKEIKYIYDKLGIAKSTNRKEVLTSHPVFVNVYNKIISLFNIELSSKEKLKISELDLKTNEEQKNALDDINNNLKEKLTKILFFLQTMIADRNAGKSQSGFDFPTGRELKDTFTDLRTSAKYILKVFCREIDQGNFKTFGANTLASQFVTKNIFAPLNQIAAEIALDFEKKMESECKQVTGEIEYNNNHHYSQMSFRVGMQRALSNRNISLLKLTKEHIQQKSGDVLKQALELGNVNEQAEITLHQYCESLALLILQSKFSEPRVYVSSGVDNQLQYNENQHDSWNKSIVINKGDEVSVIIPGLYFSNPSDNSKLKPVVKPIVALSNVSVTPNPTKQA